MYTTIWQDEADLCVGVNVLYVQSGEKEIEKYVATIIKPQLNAMLLEAEEDAAEAKAAEEVVIARAAEVSQDADDVAAYVEEVRAIAANSNITTVAENINSVNAVAAVADKIEDMNVWFKITNTTVLTSAFAADATYQDYPYAAQIAIADATADYVATVIFAVEDAISGNFAPICETGSGYVKIWAKEIPAASIVIPTIILQ